MSRTDVHRPLHLQLSDPHNRHLVYRYPAWPWQTALASFRNLCCGCKRCTGQAGRKQERRRDRTWWRKHRQQILSTTAGDRDIIDLSPRTPGW